MKRRNLFLSLICSIILTIALVTVTIISVVPKKGGTNGGQTSEQVSDGGTQQPEITINDDRDGSAEKPYVIYSADSFKTFVVDKYLDEDGKYIDYNQVDENGELVYPLLNAGLHYELDSDIDFAGQDFTTIFNKGVAFNGHIDGKGHSLKNISINVTKENLVDTYSYTEDGELVANIGIFGELDGAVIENIAFGAINVSMEEGLYSYVWSAEFKTDNGTMNAIAVGSVAAIAKDTTIKADVDVKLDAFAYSVYVQNRADGLFAVGGMVASAENCEIVDSNVNAEIVANQGTKYYVGGIAGSVLNTKIANTEVKSTVTTAFDKALYIGGAVGYSIGLNMDTVEVEFAVSEIGEERFSTKGVSSIDNTLFVSIAGAVHTINVKETAATVKNVTVKADADIDGIYAGAIMDVVNGNGTILVELTDIIVDSNVNVLKAYGFARKVVDSKITFSQTMIELVDEEEIEYNVKLTGKVRLKNYLNWETKERMYTASVFTLNFENSQLGNGEIVNGKKAVKVIVSAIIASETTPLEGITQTWGGLVKV